VPAELRHVRKSFVLHDYLRSVIANALKLDSDQRVAGACRWVFPIPGENQA